MLIDTHVHYNLEPLFSDQSWEKMEKEANNKNAQGHYSQNEGGWHKPRRVWLNHWEEAKRHGVINSIVVGTNFFSPTAATQIAGETEGLFASVGCHPSEYHDSFVDGQKHNIASFDSLYEDLDTDFEELDLLVYDKKVVAIGETGLDYYRLPSSGNERATVIDLQKLAFERHIQLAKSRDVPLILHVRDKDMPESYLSGNAYWDALAILQKNDIKRFTLHCVSGPLSYVKAAIELGGYMGFDGNITYPNAQHIRDIFSLVPKNRLLVETDAPFLPPQEFRGKTCEPWMLSKTVEYIEREMNVDRSVFAQNAQSLFKI